jgi:hypothetical protein
MGLAQRLKRIYTNARVLKTNTSPKVKIDSKNVSKNNSPVIKIR